MAAPLPPLEQTLAQAQNLLATLTGRPPADWQASNIALSDLTLPADLPVAVPSDLVRRRPDILAAEAAQTRGLMNAIPPGAQ